MMKEALTKWTATDLKALWMLHQPLKLVLLLLIQKRATFAGIPVNEAAAFL